RNLRPAAGLRLQRPLRLYLLPSPVPVQSVRRPERVMLRRGNHHSAKFWRRVLLPVIARYRELKIPKFFRGGAGFASPKLFRVLEQEGYPYVIRLKANAALERHIAHLLWRPVGRPSKRPRVFYHAFRYRAKSWDRARRMVAKVEWHAGELFPRV